MAGELPDVLPAGRVVSAAGRPLYWLSDGGWDRDLHRELLAAHPRTGWWPIVAEGMEHDPDRPWSSGEQYPEPVGDVDGYDPDTVMRSFWTDWVTSHDDEDEPEDDFRDLAPYGKHCPGLAAPGELVAAPESVADWYAGVLEPAPHRRLLLAEVARGADLPAAVGWGGPANHSDRLAPLLALLRSWEDRFGARLVLLGFDTMELSVAAPPADRAHARHVAAEHWTFCPDNVIQGAGTLERYARSIEGRNSWGFWWD